MDFHYETLKFQDKGDVVGTFLNIYELVLPRENLDRLGGWRVVDGGISFPAGVSEQGFLEVLNQGFNNVQNKITRKKTIYIHRRSGIPLLGSIEFGIIDRNA